MKTLVAESYFLSCDSDQLTFKHIWKNNGFIHETAPILLGEDFYTEWMQSLQI